LPLVLPALAVLLVSGGARLVQAGWWSRVAPTDAWLLLLSVGTLGGLLVAHNLDAALLRATGVVGHFSVVERVTEDAVFLADPAEGAVIEMDKTTFLKLWMDYEHMAYPRKNTDIQLRWMAVVTKNSR
jgi:hypothetical protein